MTLHQPLHHGVFTLQRQIKAPRNLVYDAWTNIEHRKHWFVGPGNWQLIERSVDLKVGGKEIAHGRMEDGTETIYTARFHHIIPDVQLIYAFDMHVAGNYFSASLVGVDFEDHDKGTAMTYTEQAFYLGEAYDAQQRIEGTTWLMDQFSTYLATIA